MSETTAMRVYYDGDCPFCTSYVKLARLRRAVGGVELINAREATDEIAQFAADGYDIDKGMIVVLDGKTYFGWEAVWAMNALAARSAVLRRVTNRQIIRAIYPFLRACRNLTLRAMGRKPIR